MKSIQRSRLLLRQSNAHIVAILLQSKFFSLQLVPNKREPQTGVKVAMEAVVVRHTDPISVYSLMLACYFRATVARVR